MTEPNAMAMMGPVSGDLYAGLLSAIREIGPFREEVKKTSIHLVRGAAFAGVHPRKQHLILTIKAARPIDSPRISKTEQVSKSRWHLDLKLATRAEINSELKGWIRQAYDLCA